MRKVDPAGGQAACPAGLNRPAFCGIRQIVAKPADNLGPSKSRRIALRPLLYVLSIFPNAVVSVWIGVQLAGAIAPEPQRGDVRVLVLGLVYFVCFPTIAIASAKALGLRWIRGRGWTDPAAPTNKPPAP